MAARSPSSPCLQEVRLEGPSSSMPTIRRTSARALTPKMQGDLHRKPRQSRRRRRRYRGDRGGGARGQHPADRRQHAGDAVSVRPVRMGRRHRRPFDRPSSSAATATRSAAWSWTAASSTGPQSDKYPSLTEPGARLSRSGASTRPSAISPSPSAARGRPARSRADDGADERLPDPDRHRDAAAAHGAALRQCAEVAEFLQRHPRWPGCQLCRAAVEPVSCAGAEICPKGAGAVFTFGLKGGFDAGVQAGVEGAAVLAPRQYRRHAHADHPPRLDDAPPAHRRAARSAGAGDDVVRLSIGLEDKADIIADLEQGLAAS